MPRKKFLILIVIAIVTTVWWFYQNTTSDFLIDGITVSSVTVTLITGIASTSTWILLSWASAENKNKIKVITYHNLFTGMLSGYVMAAFFSGWMGPMAGIVTGVLASASCYGIFSIKTKISSH